MNDKAPATGMRAGLARHLILDHNPLRRRTDRVQTAIMAGLLAAFLAGGAARRHCRWQLGARRGSPRAARPVVVASGSRGAAAIRASADGLPACARASHLGPGTVDTARRADPHRVGCGAARQPRGSRVLVWVGLSEPVAGVPLARDQITARVVAAGILALALLAAVILGLAWGARRLLVRRRLAAWEAAWTSVGPQWTRRGQ